FQAEDGIRDLYVTGVQTCALPILVEHAAGRDHEVDRVLVTVAGADAPAAGLEARADDLAAQPDVGPEPVLVGDALEVVPDLRARSEERRVEKECRSRRSPYHQKKR